MASRYIDPHDWEHLQELALKQDRNAHALGVATAEYEREKAKLYETQPRPDDFLLRLGALQHEYDGHVRFLMRAIQETDRERAQLGTAALKRAGEDPEKRTLTIVADGQVLCFIGGTWWEEWTNDRGLLRSNHGSHPLNG